MGKFHLIRKGKFLDYLIPGMFGGFILGLMYFLFSLLQNSYTESLKIGFTVWFGILLFYTTVGFGSEEWYLRKKKFKKLHNDKYQSFLALGFKINDDLNLVGKIDGFTLKFYLNEKYIKPKKQIDNHAVDIYCFPENFDSFRNVIDRISKISGIEDAAWGYGIFSIWFSDDTANFITPIKLALEYLMAFPVMPLSLDDWEKSFKNEQLAQNQAEEKNRTKQILKIGKLDIKYVKNKPKQI